MSADFSNFTSQYDNQPVNHPVVFISYSWDSKDHKDWVLKLASDLVSHGVDVVLDQFDVRLGDDLALFMEQGLTNAKLVLCVCSNKYVEKANTGKGGAGYEKRILTTEMINESNRRHIIPVIRNNTSTNKVPIFLYGLLYVDFDHGDYYDNYRVLLERIYDEDVNKKPTLGDNPFQSLMVSSAIEQHLKIDKIKYRNISFEGLVSFDYKRNNGLFAIGSGYYEFITMWSEAGDDSIYCYRDHISKIGYNDNCSEFPDLINIANSFDFSSRSHRIKEGDFVILENKYHHFAALKVLKVLRNNKDINHKVEFEYKIYRSDLT
jgi:hypothetical protein